MPRQIIVIEGSDGAGKTTQAKKLVDHLNETKKYGHWEYVHFPDYDTETGKVIKAYLNTNSKNIAGAYGSMMMYIARNYMLTGDELAIHHPYIQKALELISDAQYGNITIARIGKDEPNERDVDMYVKAISILYAVNRMESIETKLKKFPEDTNFVFDRYWGSNILHQATFLKTDSNIAAYSNWLKHLEMNILKNWSPSITLFLDVHEDILLKNIEKRGNGSDFLEQKENVKQFSQHKEWILNCNPDWRVINCTMSTPFGKQIKTINEIHYMILNEVKPFLDLIERPLDNDNLHSKDEVLELTTSENIPNTFGFGYALDMAKRGKRVARKGWNGKGMYVKYQKPWHVFTKVARNPIYKMPEALQIYGTDKQFSIWSPTQRDMMAEDWYIVTDEDLVLETTKLPKSIKYRFYENDRIVEVIERAVLNSRDTILGDALIYDEECDAFILTHKRELEKVAERLG